MSIIAGPRHVLPRIQVEIFHNIPYANHGTEELSLAFASGIPPWAAATHHYSQARSLLSNKVRKLEPRPTAAPLDTPTDLSEQAVREISAALNALLADTFALYVKTKNFHWHVTGPHFRDYTQACG